MRWFKHMADARRNPKILRIERVLGEAGYARFMKLLEIVASTGGSGQGFDPRLRLTDPHTDELWLANELGIRPRDLRKTLKCFAQVQLIDPNSFEHGEINIPQMLEYRDEYSSKKPRVSGHARDTVGSLSAQKEIQKDIKKEKKPCEPDGSPESSSGSFPSRAKAEEQSDSRHRQVIEFYAAEFEKRHPGLRAPLDGSDGKALQGLLRQQRYATVEQITGWLMNAFNSDPDVPPLRTGFRLREFCSHALKYTAGPLKRGSNGKHSQGGAYHSPEPGKYDHIKPDLTVVV